MLYIDLHLRFEYTNMTQVRLAIFANLVNCLKIASIFSNDRSDAR